MVRTACHDALCGRRPAVLAEATAEDAGRSTVDGALDLIASVGASNHTHVPASIAVATMKEAVGVLTFKQRDESICGADDFTEETTVAEDSANPSMTASILEKQATGEATHASTKHRPVAIDGATIAIRFSLRSAAARGLGSTSPIRSHSGFAGRDFPTLGLAGLCLRSLDARL
jgi:hypothetical protein